MNDLRAAAEALIVARSRADEIEPKNATTYGTLSLYHDALTEFQRAATPEAVVELLDRVGELEIMLRDKTAEDWLHARHGKDWYIGDAHSVEWDAAYAATDLDYSVSSEPFKETR